MTPQDIYEAIQAEGDKGSTVLDNEAITAPHTVPGVTRPVTTNHFSTNYGKQVKETISYVNPPSDPGWAAEYDRTYFDDQNYP